MKEKENQTERWGARASFLNVLLGSEAFFPALALSFFLSGLGKSQATKRRGDARLVQGRKEYGTPLFTSRRRPLS